MNRKFWNDRTHRVNRDQLEAQEAAAHRTWKKFWTPPQPGDVHDERWTQIPYTPLSFTQKFGVGQEGIRKFLDERDRQYRRRRFWRTIGALALLALWTGLFLALFSPFWM